MRTKLRKDYEKSKEDIQKIRLAGKTLAKILNILEHKIEPNVSTWDLERSFLKLCKKYEAIPACKGYGYYGFEPFPSGLCISVNEESVHCCPKKNKVLKEGDTVTIDTVIQKYGWYVDSAFAKGVGKISKEKEKLLETANRALYNAVEMIKPGIRTGVLSNTIQTTVQKEGFDVLRDYAGHSIGRSMHEDIDIPCFGSEKEGKIIEEGMLLAVEALVCEGDPKIKYLNNWETRMADGKDWVSFEHTVLVTKNSYEIITDRKLI